MSGLTIGSLFSGIGGMELGLERAGHGPVLWQVERNPFCRAVLAKHWPTVERFADVCAVGGCAPWGDLLERPGILCGGFPCQDTSGCGLGKGLAGERSGLLFEFVRIAGDLKPPWVIVENVTSGAIRWVDSARGALGQQGYETIPLRIRASDVGAPHRRSRIFILGRRVADPDGQALRNTEQRGSGGRPRVLRDQGEGVAGHHSEAKGRDAQPGVGGGVDGFSTWLDTHSAQTGRSVRWPAGHGAPPHRWEPPMAVPLHIVPKRNERSKALGNAVVPQCAEVVGEMINLLRDSYAA